MKTSRSSATINKLFDLDEDPGVAEGQDVEVQVRLIDKPPRQPGEGFLRTEVALADDEEWDKIMDEIYKARKLERRPQVSDLDSP